MELKTLDLNPYKAEEAAKMLYKAICELATKMGQDPKIECGLRTPEQASEEGMGMYWRVLWEGGPEYWALCLQYRSSIFSESHQIKDRPPEFLVLDSEHWFVDSYYAGGFDLGFIGD